MTKQARGAKGRGRRKAPAKPPRRPVPREPDPWAQLTLIVLGVVLALRLGINALELVPVHFGEAQAWADGQAPALGYFFAPPLLAWIMRGATEALGDTLFALRLPGAAAHALIGWLIFLAGRRLWDGRTGFWAAAGYTAAPGVAFSAMLMSADPVVMLCWAGALYALVRATDEDADAQPRLWWPVLGALIGLGLMASYTMAAFVLGALGYGLVSARGRAWKGPALATVAALAVFAPNIWWNAAHGLIAWRHFAAALDPGRGHVSALALAEFAGVQLGLIGPVFLAAIGVALRNRAFWREDRGMRLAAWLTLPLLAALAALALARGTNGTWTAPAYVGGALMAARWLVRAGGLPALRAQLGVGVAASLTLWTAAGLYAGQADALTRRLDPFRATRLSRPFCELALGAMSEEGAEVLLADNPRRLAECMFYGGLGWGQVAIWNPAGRAQDEAELIAPLRPGDGRPMLLAVTHGAQGMVHRFAQAHEVESGRLATHIDRWVPYALWGVRGFRGYR